MKKVFFSIAVFFVFSLATVSAADIRVNSSAQVPSGYTLNSNGYYTNSSSSDRYYIANTESTANSTYNSAASDSTNILWIDDSRLRSGDLSMEDIPLIIVSVIEYLIAIAGTISIVALIYHAIQMQLNSGITGDSSWVDKAKKWMIGSLIGFVVAMLAWFIVARFVEVLSSIS